MTLKIHLIAAARPNFMKIAPLYHALKKETWAETTIVHTGQHYELNMSDIFFQELGLPEPEIHLNIGSGTHAEQMGRVMIAYEKTLIEHKPNLVIVVGDVNSTAACTLSAAKLGIKTAHLEAGLRSFDKTMPEEINRIVTDSLADYLWTPSPDADKNLLKEGHSTDKISQVGNIMIDSLEMMRGKIEQENVCESLHLKKHKYCLVTLHRPSNVDNYNLLAQIMEALEEISQHITVVFPVHPRTRNSLGKLKKYAYLANPIESAIISSQISNLLFTEPLPYLSFMKLVFNTRLTITDSGGIQEETTYLGVPCITLRDNTERPVTITQGTNQLCRPDQLINHFHKIVGKKTRQGIKIQMWDGNTAERIIKEIKSKFKK